MQLFVTRCRSIKHSLRADSQYCFAMSGPSENAGTESEDQFLHQEENEMTGKIDSVVYETQRR